MPDTVPTTTPKEPTKAQLRDALYDVLYKEADLYNMILHLSIARAVYRAYPEAVTGEWPDFLLSMANLNQDEYGDVLAYDDAIIGTWKALEPGGLEIFMTKARELAKQRLEEARAAQSAT